MQHENLADIRHKLSIIYKHIQLMHNDLRYQAKTHTISEKLSKEKIKFCILSPNFYFYFLFFILYVENNKIEKQQGHAYGKGNNI
jgi:hypothetical protein